MNFGNVTVGEVLLPMPESIVSASQRTARTPPSTFLFLPIQLSNSVAQDKASIPRPKDDNTPGSRQEYPTQTHGEMSIPANTAQMAAPPSMTLM